MAMMKRRVIYMSDGEWTAVTETSRQRSQSVSSYIRECVGLLPRTNAEVVVPAFRDVTAADLRAFRPVPKPTRKGK